ncbi:MAG: acetylxylan esterase [Clostridia bacterium]|nr:acetylxylan esterase [Clostridia bacterium]
MQLHSLYEVRTPVNPQTLDEWKKMREDLIESIRFSSSIDLLSHDAPLSPVIFGKTEFSDFVVEKVIIQTLPGFYVAGNLYRPKDLTRKYPAILNPHGHWDKGRVDMDPLGELPTRCANFAMRGMVAFIYDMVGYNDSNQVKHHVDRAEYDDWNFGRFSLQLNNSVKALDFVSSLPYVDAGRIGCTGCSGGGTQTWFLAALDERIKAAAPVNMVSAYMQGGCNCENAPFLRNHYCSVDYAMCISPRPLFLAASDGDWTSHSREVEFPAIRRVYDLYGAEKNLETFYQSAPHCYNKPARERVYDFFCRAFGTPNPSMGEISVEIDAEALLIGDIRPYVKKEGFIDNEDALFSVVKKIMRKNLCRLSEKERDNIICRVFPDMPAEALDIPYILEDPEGGPVIHLASRPPQYEIPDIPYNHCYNYGHDTRRISSLIALFKECPERICVASGKSAYLAGIASAIIGKENVRFENPAQTDIDIPGIELLRNMPGSPIGKIL